MSRLAYLCGSALLAGCAGASARVAEAPDLAIAPAADAAAPEPASVTVASDGAGAFDHAAVAADHPLASELGARILAQGGNAADAAVTTALALGVLNPFASGLGGGGVALWRGVDAEVVALNFRETAPAAASRTMFIGPDGDVVAGRSTTGGLAVAVPGELAGLWALHSRYGALPWAAVVAPVATLARDGFPAGELLPTRVAADPMLASVPALADRYLVDGEPVAAGDLIRIPELADALDRIATTGVDDFYRGQIAVDIVAAVTAAGGILTADDLATYAVVWDQPLQQDVAGYTLYAMPSPSSGGFVVLTALKVLEAADLAGLSLTDAPLVHRIAQTFAHLFADRAASLGDAQFVEVPWDALMGPDRVEEIRGAFDAERTLTVDAYGSLVDVPPDDGTSHISIVDAHGNAVALTTTVNTSFGSHVVSERFGILLNNQMDDFAASPGVPNAFGLVGNEANAIAPRKRPLSSMSPTLVVDALPDGAGLVGVVGGSGGPQIITATTLALIRMIWLDRDVHAAVASPRFHHQWLPFELTVEDTMPISAVAPLEALGYTVTSRTFGSAVQLIWRRDDGGWDAASDPRKRGAPAGF